MLETFSAIPLSSRPSAKRESRDPFRRKNAGRDGSLLSLRSAAMTAERIAQRLQHARKSLPPAHAAGTIERDELFLRMPRDTELDVG
jgi:hypothetical protein